MTKREEEKHVTICHIFWIGRMLMSWAAENGLSFHYWKRVRRKYWRFQKRKEKSLAAPVSRDDCHAVNCHTGDNRRKKERSPIRQSTGHDRRPKRQPPSLDTALEKRKIMCARGYLFFAREDFLEQYMTGGHKERKAPVSYTVPCGSLPRFANHTAA